MKEKGKPAEEATKEPSVRKQNKTEGYELLDDTEKCLKKKGVFGSAKCDERSEKMKFES